MDFARGRQRQEGPGGGVMNFVGDVVNLFGGVVNPFGGVMLRRGRV